MPHVCVYLSCDSERPDRWEFRIVMILVAIGLILGVTGVMVGGLRELLDVQMQRLTDPEQELLRRMAVAREPRP